MTSQVTTGSSDVPSSSVSQSGLKAKPAEGPLVRFGVTEPISLRLPAVRDRFLTQKLESMMKAKNLYETAEGQRVREFVLDELKKLLSVRV